MISYEPMKRLMKERGVRNKDLIEAGINPFVTFSLKLDITTDTLNALCKFFNCGVSNLISFSREGKKKIVEDDVKTLINWDVLSDYINQSNMTFSSISHEMGKSKEWLRSKRAGNFMIKLSELETICSFIGVPVGEVIKDD